MPKKKYVSLTSFAHMHSKNETGWYCELQKEVFEEGRLEF